MDMVRIFWILYNRFSFSLHGIRYGKGLRVFNHLYLKLKGNTNVQIGDDFGFSSGGGYNCLSRNVKGAIELEKGASLTIGNNVGISSSCLWVFTSLSIGNNTKIGADCIILDSDTHSLDYLMRQDPKQDRPNATSKSITIGSNVLIGTRSIILKGVSIGDRSVIGAGSVVTSSIPSDCIAAGNPCKVIKRLQ